MKCTQLGIEVYNLARTESCHAMPAHDKHVDEGCVLSSLACLVTSMVNSHHQILLVLGHLDWIRA